jgi:hypothetical protein
MVLTAKLAGFFVAHAVWCISDGETLVPLVGFEGSDGSQQMCRFVAEDLQDGVRQGKEWLARNPESARRAVLVYDGFITLPSGKTDALIIEAVEFEAAWTELMMAVPYRQANSPNGFAVHRLKFLSVKGSEQEFGLLGEAFFRGVAEHEKGAAVWNENLDQSR